MQIVKGDGLRRGETMKKFLMSVPWILMGSCDGLKSNCEDDTGAYCGDRDADSDSDADTDADADVDADSDVDLIADSELTFSTGVHPCSGNRTDALWVDSVHHAWVGCGTTPTGKGLYHSSDGGGDWSGVSGFEDMRVNHLWRETPSGPLYVSGNSTVGDERVVAFDGAHSTVWLNGNVSETSFSVGSFAMSFDGTQVVESLTGNGVVVRSSGDVWRSGYGWWSNAGHSAVQIMDLDVAAGWVVGVGNVISEPSVVYLPPREWGFGSLDATGERATGLWEIVELQGDIEPVIGEIWDIDGDRHGLVVGGVDQANARGTVWTIGDDWLDSAYEASAWKFTDVSSVVGSTAPTWVRGVCRRGDRVAVVGEYSSLGDGLLLISQDGGQTFVDRTLEVNERLPGGATLGPLHRCHFLNTGELFAAGADGRLVRHTQ